MHSFSIDGRTFKTPEGQVTARVTNNLDAVPADGASDAIIYNLAFSDGRKLSLRLSDVGLSHDSDYRTRVFLAVQHWLDAGGSATLEMFE